ncbi:hypothetical protein HZH68_014329 [Vespula germanica]|uniref:Battenin n=1 Tax=Vespula germanica TaxID=30212 RepID=A0A834JCN1_VESGE|nr:hypothetical protein HZH68_014329 [Vespula germanica]
MARGILQRIELNVTDEIDEERKLRRLKWRNLVAFWILGMCNNYGYIVMLSAAHDILESRFGTLNTTIASNGTNTNNERSCNGMSTGAILLADILPCLVIKIIAPFLPFFVQ